MALPPLVSASDLAAAYPGLDPARLDGAVAAASALVRAYTRRPSGWVDGDGGLAEPPDAVVQAVLLIARRVASMPDAAVSDETAGPFSVKRDSSMWLSATEKILLDTALDTSGTVTTLTARGPVPAAVTVDGWVPVGDGRSDPAPWTW